MKKLLISCLISSALFGCGQDAAISKKLDKLPQEALALAINRADNAASSSIPLGSLTLDDCIALYTDTVETRSAGYGKEAFVAKAKQDCPTYMGIIHSFLAPQFKSLLTVQDLQDKIFWTRYLASQKIVLQNSKQKLGN
jgi:hypothetical protein